MTMMTTTTNDDDDDALCDVFFYALCYMLLI